MPADFAAIFARLRAILQKNIGQLSVKDDSPTCYCLQGGLHPTHKTPMSIAWVKISKTYVSYHLMPVYGCPQLLDGYSPHVNNYPASGHVLAKGQDPTFTDRLFGFFGTFKDSADLVPEREAIVRFVGRELVPLGGLAQAGKVGVGLPAGQSLSSAVASGGVGVERHAPCARRRGRRVAESPMAAIAFAAAIPEFCGAIGALPQIPCPLATPSIHKGGVAPTMANP
jgi:hypothetical protein